MNLPVVFKPVGHETSVSWVDDLCSGPLYTLNRYVPRTFHRYLRVCHPAYRLVHPLRPEEEASQTPTQHAPTETVPIRWDDLARLYGHTYDGKSHWASFSATFDRASLQKLKDDILPPQEGSLSLEIAESTFAVLRRNGGPKQLCGCAFWNGFKVWDFPDTTQLMKMGQRSHSVMTARLEDVEGYWCDVLQSGAESAGLVPQALWAIDRSWFLAVPFERFSSLLGGNDKVIREMLAIDALESYELFEGDKVQS